MQNKKIRVNNFTRIDKDEEKLIEDLYFIYMPIGFIFILIAFFSKFYFVAFAYILYFFTFRFQKNIAPRKRKEKSINDLSLISNDNLKNKYSVHLGSLVKTHKKNLDVLNLFNTFKKSLGFTYEIKETIPSQKLTSNKNNAITPILINDEMLREHCALMATSGGGKTELLINSYIESTIARGAGVFSVFGKADNIMLQRVQSICAKYNRLSDLLVFDFNPNKVGKFHSNSINLFELGAAKDVITMFVNIAEIDTRNDNGGWNAKSKKYLTSILRTLLILRDSDFFIDVTKIDKIYNSKNKYEEYQRHLTKIDYYGFNKLFSETDLLIKFLLIFDEMYRTNNKDINARLYQKFTKILNEAIKDNNSIAYLNNSDKNQFHSELKDDIISLSNVADWQKLSDTYINGIKDENENKIYGLEAISLKYPQRSGTFYDLSVCQGGVPKIQEFFNSFASILKNTNSDINIIDALDANKIVIVNLPGQNKVYAPVLAQLIMSSISLIAERRGKDYIPDSTTLVLLDEINSWLKGTNDKSYGLGDILSVIRSLHMGAVLSFQSDIKETLGSIDSSQAFAIIKTIITLKNEEPELIKFLNEKVSKVQKLDLEESLEKTKTSKKSQNTEDKRYTKSEDDYFKSEMLSSIKNGEGYIIRNSIAHPFMSKFSIQKSLYETTKDEVKLNRYVSESKIIEKRKELIAQIKQDKQK